MPGQIKVADRDFVSVFGEEKMTPQIEVDNHLSVATDISEPLLLAKTSPPEIPGWVVSRPRIDKLIQKGVQRGTVTLVSGPPGAGKTVALAHWVATSRWPGPVAWLTLDEYDDASDHFWHHLAAALSRAGIQVPASGFAGDPDAPLQIASALATVESPAVLVLDNLHMMHSPRRVAGLGYLLRHAKPGLRVVAAARTAQPLPLHHYRLTDDLTEVHAGQLAFTGPETSSLLATHDVVVYREALMPLVKRMEGWVTGLRFAAIALSGGGPVDLSDVDQQICGYLISEAFDTQPACTQDFLLRTSVPERITADLAQALTDRDPAAPSLPEIVRANLFIQPAGSGWYRYHALFRDVLQARLRHENPDVLPGLLRRAAEWHRQRGQLADAVRYAASAGDGTLARRIILDELAVSRLLDPDRGQGLLNSLQDIPLPVAAVGPGECAVAAAGALARQDHGAAAVWLGRTDEILRRLPPEAEIASRLAAAVIRFSLARSTGDLGALDDAAAEHEEVLTRMPADVLSAHEELALRTLTSRGEAELWQGRFDDAEKVFAEAAALPVPDGAAAERAACLGGLALAEALSGRLVRAAELAVQAAAEPGAAAPGTESCDAGAESPPNVPADIALAWVHLERNELDQVRSSLRRAGAGLCARHDRGAAALASLVAAWLFLAEGHGEAALGMLERARHDWSPPPWLDQRLALAEARAEVMAGNPLAALRAVDRCAAMPKAEAVTARAYAWVAAGNFAAARRELRYVFEVAAAEPACSVDRVMLDALLTDARAHYATGERAAGRASLARALRIARGEDVRLPFDMERSWIFPVLRADAELARSYQAMSQIDLAADGCHPLGSLATATAGSALVEPLTEREQEVLRRVGRLLSTAEIANELYISVNTVKTHLKNVHRKLAVTHRREAVRRARQLKLL